MVHTRSILNSKRLTQWSWLLALVISSNILSWNWSDSFCTQLQIRSILFVVRWVTIFGAPGPFGPYSLCHGCRTVVVLWSRTCYPALLIRGPNGGFVDKMGFFGHSPVSGLEMKWSLFQVLVVLPFLHRFQVFWHFRQPRVLVLEMKRLTGPLIFGLASNIYDPILHVVEHWPFQNEPFAPPTSNQWSNSTNEVWCV